MSAPDPRLPPLGRAVPRSDTACYRDTVRLLASLSKRHRNALEEFAGSTSAPCNPNAARTALTDQLGERVAQLEDTAVRALARLAGVTDYEDALAAMQESGSAVWLWGAVLNRAVEATAVARISSQG